MNGSDFIAGVRQHLQERDLGGTNNQVADFLGMSLQSVQNWKNSPEITVRQMLTLIDRIEQRARERAVKRAIRPIVEFLRIDKRWSRQAAKLEIFNPRDDQGSESPHLKGLQEELKAHHGIYVFHDSRGRGLYAGKA